jgi:hypothetical protein
VFRRDARAGVGDFGDDLIAQPVTTVSQPPSASHRAFKQVEKDLPELMLDQARSPPREEFATHPDLPTQTDARAVRIRQ